MLRANSFTTLVIIIVKHDLPLPVLCVASVFSVELPSLSTIQLASELNMCMVARTTPMNDIT